MKRATATAKEEFRRSRIDEPRRLYEDEFRKFRAAFALLLEDLATLAIGSQASEASRVLQSAKTRLAFRYATAPPISADDLATLAGGRLSSRKVRDDPAFAARVREVLLASLDRTRFPWIVERRMATEGERDAALTATATLFAASFVGTQRRSAAKRDQEAHVIDCVRKAGYVETSRRRIDDVRDAPAPGEFCGESRLGETKADLIVVLHDRRIMPIECKVSNSEVNSFKRLIHEAAGKAAKWTSGFGKRAIVPAAVLSGCYTVENLITAQSQGLSLFWTHDLGPLRRWLAQAK